MKNKLRQNEIWKFLMVAAGTILFSTAINLFLTPLGLYNGGALGISQLIRTVLIEYLHVPIPAKIDISGIVYLAIFIRKSKSIHCNYIKVMCSTVNAIFG